MARSTRDVVDCDGYWRLSLWEVAIGPLRRRLTGPVFVWPLILGISIPVDAIGMPTTIPHSILESLPPCKKSMQQAINADPTRAITWMEEFPLLAATVRQLAANGSVTTVPREGAASTAISEIYFFENDTTYVVVNTRDPGTSSIETSQPIEVVVTIPVHRRPYVVPISGARSWYLPQLQPASAW